MRKPIEKILVILFIVVLLPAIFFSVYEINSLNENEKVIDNVYQNQLKATIISINKYSNDVVNDWMQKLNLIIAGQGLNGVPNKEQALTQFLKLNSNIKIVILGSQEDVNKVYFYSSAKGNLSDIEKEEIINKLKVNGLKIERLLAGRQNGLTKVERFKIDLGKSKEIIVFPLNYTRDANDFCCILFDANIFLQNIMLPELDNAIHKDFIYSVVNNKTGKVIYSNGSNGYSDIEQKETLSLLPQFSIGIMMKGQTISQLVKQRNNRTLILILFVDVLLLIGFWYAVRNIKREMELTKMKADFVANVSHELRTPLSLINLFAETLVLGRAASFEKQKEYQKIILNETNRLSRIVNKILSFYEIEDDKKAYHFKPTDLNKIVQNVIDTYSYQLDNAGFIYSLKLEENIPMISGDEESLTEALINLVDNSVKYSKEIKKLEIETGTLDGFVFLKIRDHGMGISAHNLKKIFDKFYRVQNGFVHETKGAGLGLSIVKSIIEAHKGEIRVQSNEGEGSCFELKFRKSDNGNNKSTSKS